MLESNATKSCRNNSINTRRLIAAAWLAITVPLSASALEIESPAVGLTGVPLEYSVSGAADGDTVTLAIAGRQWSGTADADGRAEFEDVVVEIAEIDIVRSKSMVGLSVVQVTADDAITDTDQVWDDVRAKVTSLQGILPSGSA